MVLFPWIGFVFAVIGAALHVAVIFTGVGGSVDWLMLGLNLYLALSWRSSIAEYYFEQGVIAVWKEKVKTPGSEA